MVRFQTRTRHASFDSPISLGPLTSRSRNGDSHRTEVGEIDTSAPFQSVKAAVSLFGEAATSPRISRPLPTTKSKTTDETVLEKESALQLALKQLDDCRGRLKITETAKAEALCELEKANRTLEELTNKLETISEFKKTAIEATEATKQRPKDLGEDKPAAELVSAKQELTALRQDFDAVLEAKLAAFQEATHARHIIQVNQDRATKISKEITALREKIGQVKLAREERNKSDEETQSDDLQSHKIPKKEQELKTKYPKQESHPSENIEEKLEETLGTIKRLKQQLNNIRNADSCSSLKNATKELQEIVEDEISQRRSVDFLKLELDNVKRDHSELQNKASKADSTAESLQIELERHKIQLKAALEGEESNDIHIKLQKLASEAENARQEAEDIKKNIALLKRDTETARTAAQQAEERLKSALNEVEAAKAAERLAIEMIHNPFKTDAALGKTSNSNSKVKLPVEDFESLSKKAEESSADADLKVATVMAQIETIKASESETLKKLEASMKEKKAIESAIEDTLKQAKMAEAAKKMVEGELMKWRQKEQKV